MVVPAGTRIQVFAVVYQTDVEAVIGRYDSVADTTMTAVATGPGPNGDALYAPGVLLDVVPGVGQATLISAVSGGAEPESDASLRRRARLARSRVAAAGPDDRWAALALDAHPGVGDAAVSTPEPGVVRVTVAGHGGEEPSAAAVASVEAALVRDDVRPATMTVLVTAPSITTDELHIQYTVVPAALGRLAAVEADVVEAVARYRDWQEGGLGRDITPSQLVATVQAVAGVASVRVLAPREFRPVDADELVRLRLIAVRYTGAAS